MISKLTQFASTSNWIYLRSSFTSNVRKAGSLMKAKILSTFTWITSMSCFAYHWIHTIPKSFSMLSMISETFRCQKMASFFSYITQMRLMSFNQHKRALMREYKPSKLMPNKSCSCTFQKSIQMKCTWEHLPMCTSQDKLVYHVTLKIIVMLTTRMKYIKSQ